MVWTIFEAGATLFPSESGKLEFLLSAEGGDGALQRGSADLENHGPRTRCSTLVWERRPDIKSRSVVYLSTTTRAGMLGAGGWGRQRRATSGRRSDWDRREVADAGGRAQCLIPGEPCLVCGTKRGHD